MAQPTGRSNIRGAFSHHCSPACRRKRHDLTIEEWEYHHGCPYSRPDSPIPPMTDFGRLRALTKIKDNQPKQKLPEPESQSKPTIVSSPLPEQVQPMQSRGRAFMPPVLSTPFEQKPRTESEIRQDQLLDHHGRQRAHEVDWLQSRKQYIEEQIAILQNWRRLRDSVSTAPGLSQNSDYIGSSSNWAIGDAEQFGLLAGIEIELKDRIQKITDAEVLFAPGWERTPIEERLRSLWQSLDRHCRLRYEGQKQAILQTRSDRSGARTAETARAKRQKTHAFLAESAVPRVVDNFEIMAKNAEVNRDEEVEREAVKKFNGESK